MRRAARLGMQVLGVVAALVSRDALADAATEAKARALQQGANAALASFDLDRAEAFLQTALRLCLGNKCATMLVASLSCDTGTVLALAPATRHADAVVAFENAIRLDPAIKPTFRCATSCGCFCRSPEVGRGAPVKSGMRFGMY